MTIGQGFRKRRGICEEVRIQLKMTKGFIFNALVSFLFPEI